VKLLWQIFFLTIIIVASMWFGYDYAKPDPDEGYTVEGEHYSVLVGECIRDSYIVGAFAMAGGAIVCHEQTSDEVEFLDCFFSITQIHKDYSIENSIEMMHYYRAMESEIDKAFEWDSFEEAGEGLIYPNTADWMVW
jgi:hypothetical protein